MKVMGPGAPPCEKGASLKYIGEHCMRKEGACEAKAGASDGHGARRPAVVRPNRSAYIPIRGSLGSD